MSKRKYSQWEIMFYVSLLVILVWLFFKVTGVINTPAWLEYGVPIFSGVFGFFALFRDLIDRISRVGKGLTRTETKVEYIEKDVGELKTKVSHIDRDMHFLKTKIK